MAGKAPRVRRFEASAEVATSPDRASAVILAPESVPLWFKGAKEVKAWDGYPAKGGRIAWRIGPSRFSGVVVESRLPGRLVLNVATPSGSSVVSQAFEATGSGTRYTKVVEATLSGSWGWLAPLFLPGAVRREVRRAAALLSPPPLAS